MNDLKTKPNSGIYTLYILWAIACFAFFQFGYHYHFFYQEQNQLFLWSTDYLVTYLDKPGWLACMTGDFLTQFYYYPYIGALILTFSLLLLGHNVRCSTQVAGIKTYWIPYLVSFITITVFAWLCLDHDYRLSNLLAISGGASVFRVSTKMLGNTRNLVKKLNKLEGNTEPIENNKLLHWASTINIVVTVPVCHWFFGVGVWVYCLFVVIGCLYYIMLPYSYLRLASVVLTMFVLLLGKHLYFISFEELYTYPGLGKFVKPELDWEKTYAVDFEYYRGNYNKVMNIVEKEEKPNPYMTFYYNLVVAQNKNLSANLLKFPNNNLGTYYEINYKTSTLTNRSLGELYWLLGDMTFAERAAILGNISSPSSRNIRQIKRLAEINLVTGEKKTAKKYLHMLQKTFVWNHWADRILTALSKKATDEDRATLQPYLAKRKFLNTRDTLRADDNCYTIMQELCQSNKDNSIAINYLLCTDILLKNIEAFKHNYDAYYLQQTQPLYTTFYQQVLVLYLDKKHAPWAEYKKYIKHPEVLKRYQEYKQNPGDESFKDTYWYYYDHVAVPKFDYMTKTI